MDKVEVKKNSQQEISLALPPRGTGRKTGTAKNPEGPDNRLTEEERKKRHKEQVGE